MAPWRDRVLLLVTLGGLLLAWQALSWGLGLAFLPGPGEVVSSFVQGLVRGDLAGHLAVSAYRVGLSVAVAVAVATPLGLAVALNRVLYRVTSPLVYLTYPIPKIVLLPIVIMFLGLGDASKVAIISLILFFQVFLVVRDAASTVRPELVHSVRSLGAGPWQLLRHVYLPASLPAVLTALRVSVGTAIAVLFFVESFGTTAGLGYYILVESWGRLAYVQMYSGVLAMALLGVSLYYAIDLAQRRLCRWVEAGR